MTIDWGALALVAAVSLAVAVLVVVLVSLALVGLSARELGRAREAAEAPAVPGGRPSRLSPTAGTVLATLCLLAAAAIVLYGFSLIVF